ncbi:MAG: hypothetical protein ACFCVD_12925 [Nodosilinea sp.]
MELNPQSPALNGVETLSVEVILRPVLLSTGSSRDEYGGWAAYPMANLSAVSTSSTVLAQQFDQDILGDMGNAWQNFIQSGQVWALVVGIVLGYLIRNLTAY